MTHGEEVEDRGGGADLFGIGGQGGVGGGLHHGQERGGGDLPGRLPQRDEANAGATSETKDGHNGSERHRGW